MDEELIGKEVTADEVAFFYKKYPAFWFLLEVLEKDKNGRAEMMRVIEYGKSKDLLRDYLMDHGGDGQYIFVYAGPDGKCEI